METFDVLDCTGKTTGEIISRDEAHRTGTWHGAFHCLVIYERDDGWYALFQKRSSGKKIAPDKFDVSVGGHYSAGEDAAVAGPREIAEELGLEVEFSDLYPVGRRVFVYCFTSGVKEYEFQDVFLLPGMVRPGDLNLQKEEVDAVLEMDIERGIRMFNGQTERVECSLYSPAGVQKVCVTPAEFVPCIDNYYLKLLLLAQRYLDGERQLLFI